MGDGGRPTTLVHLRPTNDTMNAISFLNRVLKPLDDEQSTPLRATITISSGRERLALPGRAKKVSPREPKVHLHCISEVPDSSRRSNLTSGLVMAFTPPANAAVQSPCIKARQASTMETREEEHAVSVVIEGPLHP